MEHQFTKSNLRYGSLREVTFSTGARGKKITPFTMLLAAPDVIRGALKVYCRDDVTGDWAGSEVGQSRNTPPPAPSDCIATG